MIKIEVFFKRRGKSGLRSQIFEDVATHAINGPMYQIRYTRDQRTRAQKTALVMLQNVDFITIHEEDTPSA